MSLVHVYLVTLFDGERSHPALDTFGGTGGPDTRCACSLVTGTGGA